MVGIRVACAVGSVVGESDGSEVGANEGSSVASAVAESSVSLALSRNRRHSSVPDATNCVEEEEKKKMTSIQIIPIGLLDPISLGREGKET